jgi:hypothetical protein
MTDRSERIEHIADLIRSWKFRYGETYKALAREWGVAYAYVRELGAEAFRLVGDEVTEPEETTVNVCVGLERIMRDAVESGDPADRRAAIDAGRVWVQLAKDRKSKQGGVGALSEAEAASILAAVRSRGT